jgi:hypothetical protein
MATAQLDVIGHGPIHGFTSRFGHVVPLPLDPIAIMER